MERIGIIDLGSNSARLVVVEMLGDGHFMVIDQLKESVRLGKDMERDGFLKPARIAARQPVVGRQRVKRLLGRHLVAAAV